MAEDNKFLFEQIQALVKATEDNLSGKSKEQIDAIMLQVETMNQKIESSASKNDLKEIAELRKQLAEVNANMKKNQEVIDNFVAEGGNRKSKNLPNNFLSAFAMKVEEKKGDFQSFAEKGRKGDSLVIELPGVMDIKTVGDMTTSGNLTGDPQFSYNQRQGLIPMDKINIRDLIPTAQSATGQYITFTEGAGEGAPSQQTEGSAKSQVDSDFTNVKTVTSYLSAYQRFTKQFMFNLPWVQTTLSRILLRKFYQKENTLFYATLSANSSPATTSGGNDAEKLIDMIAQQGGSNFASDFFLIPWATWGSLLKTGYPSTATAYSVPGGVTFDTNGVARIAGVPTFAAPWVTSGDLQLVDRDYIERVEVESLRVEFSYEDADNFTKNKITARIECLEELNLIRTDAHLNYGTAS